MAPVTDDIGHILINPGEYLNLSFKPTKAKSASYRLNWQVPQNLPYFQGHFPNNPVLPAVAILDISIEMIKGFSKNPDLVLQNIKTAKFLEPIAPERQVLIQIENIALSRWGIVWFDGKRPDKKIVKLQLAFFSPQD